MCGLCQHLVGPSLSPIFSSLPWQFTFVHPLLGHTWTKHSSRIVCRLFRRPPSPLDYSVLLNNLCLVLPQQMHLLDCDPSPIQSLLHPSRSSNVLNLLHISAAYGRKVLMLHGTEFRSRLGMATNTSSSVYKPLHEYRILRASNSPHLCEFCTTFSIVTQHLPLCTISSLTKHPSCLEHHQVWLPTSSRSSNSAIPIFVRYAFFFACLSSWCLSRKVVGHSSECQTWMPAPLSDSFPYNLEEAGVPLFWA
ncbi:hypothetical protein BHM03_00007453 [Ensete ventricosum]|nr:hypothetical protein BHM03_00007453 [Ensete ventricosum]